VELGHLVKDFARVFQGLETMSKSFGYIYHCAVVGCEFDRTPLAEGKGLAPEVHHYVIDRPSRASHQLDLGIRGNAVMEPSQCPARFIERRTALDQDGIEAARLELLSAIGTRKYSALVH
jgi:hypothetical protein